MIWLALGCAGDDDPTGPAPETTADTGVPLTPGCHLDPANALRFRCGYERDGAGPIEVRVSGGDGGTVTFPGDPDLLDGRIDVWDLLTGVPYDWVLVDRGTEAMSGTLTPEPPPDAMALVMSPLVDGPSSVSRTVFTMSCGRGPTIFATDAQDRVRWYQEIVPDLFVAGFDATDRGSVLANVGRSQLQEWGYDGVLRTQLGYPGELPYVTHHAILGRDGTTVVLDTQEVGYPDGHTYLVDGITEVVGGSATHVWDVGQVLDPQGLVGEDGLYWEGWFPGAVDFGHENAIDALDDGGWLVSFKHLDTVARLNPDLTLRWWLPGALVQTDLAGPRMTLGSSVGLPAAFAHQHHVTMDDDGGLLLFDNGRDGVPSQVLELGVDEVALAADVRRSWNLGVACPVQSSAFRLPDGSILAACAASREIFELDDSGIRRRVKVSCGDGGLGTSFVRAQPVDRLTP